MRPTGKATKKLIGRVKLALSKLPATVGTTELMGQPYYYGAEQKASFTFLAKAPGQVTVELVNTVDGRAVRNFTHTAGAAGEQPTIVWDGTVDGKPAPEGNYAFHLAGASTARASAVSASEGFAFRHTIFPVRGAHDFGNQGSRFGAGRSGHNHQGHDVFAKCGTPIAAAQGGKVIYSGFHSAAGNYVVIRGWASNEDFVYMHMENRSSLQVGATVPTGANIGTVGETGNAQGCHLHFELWSSPGWYAGGKPYDPFGKLQLWSSYS
jgi:murein DD-endopeptidase MepM/ murein hydrolase activator NlpD